MTHPLLIGLNAQQQRAVQAIHGPVLVLAGPGSGKTRVLTHRIAYLINEVGVRPYNILAVTFTNKAAREMRERLSNLIGESRAHDVMMGTFHSICARWLRRDIQHLQRANDFVVYDADDQQRVMKQILRELDLSEKQYNPRSIHARISAAKNELIGVAEFARSVSSYFDEIVLRCYERYEKQLFANNALDFDDLLLKTVNLFEYHSEVLARYAERYVHVMVDEVQDTNRVQFSLVNHVGAGHNNYFLIGDIQQSIYAWRGARLANVREFEEAHPDVQIIPLEQNYRSTQPILDVAQSIIDAAHDRRHTTKIWTDQQDGDLVSLVEAYDHNEEARWVADEIMRIRGRDGRSLDDFAVMYRTNAQSRAFEEAMISRGLRYKLVGGTRFYERKEIKDIVAYLRIIHNPHDEVSLLRVINVPGRSIGDRTQQELLQWARNLDISIWDALELLVTNEAQNPPIGGRARNAVEQFQKLVAGLRDLRHDLMLGELIQRLLERVPFQELLVAEYGEEEGAERWENILELQNVSMEYLALPTEDQLPRFLEEVALVSDVDSLDTTKAREPGVTLITLHQAKGLEYPVVFLAGLEEGLLPHGRSIDDPESIEEERRLLYVGTTRAKQRLYMLYAFKRATWGRTDLTIPSRFLGDIPKDLLQRTPTREVKQMPVHAATQWQSSTPQRTRGAQPSSSSMWSGASGSARPKRPEREPSAASYSAGDKVRHANFGEGVVVSSKMVGDDEEVTVAFPGKGVKKLLAAFAKLERV
ncbi:ATP-dependent helicase [Herpetosiphon geysericola]|uniref:DNA 3'-5' helicase n=1 Tax=Herpetosiphon geysericola TaxID=70996 RepID=A0A0P6YQA7_9CHLR|nr:UvrD-helicase domain-containing protein [Herpetosiphon geysericola]KPL85232.1 DNA helicase UvrD [Herpetosiphon geysericola]